MDASAAMPKVAANIDWLFCELPFVEGSSRPLAPVFTQSNFSFHIAIRPLQSEICCIATD